MSEMKKALTDLILKPVFKIHLGVRNVLRNLGWLKHLDFLFQDKFEDPVLWWYLSDNYDLEVFNDDVIPTKEEGSAVFASNHTSILDSPFQMLAVYHNTKRLPRVLTKAELGQDPVFGYLTEVNASIYVHRGAKDTDAIQECVNAIKDDDSMILVYPEGTYGPGKGEFLPFKSGAARIAWGAQVPIIPLGVYGLDKVLPKSKFKEFKKSSKDSTKFSFGKPIPLSTLFPGKNKEDNLTKEDFVKATAMVEIAVHKLWNEMDAKFHIYT